MKDKLVCEICKKELLIISPSHLRKHNLNILDYRKMFPNAEISSIKIWLGKELSRDHKQKISEANKISTKKLWQNNEYRKIHIEATKQSHNTLEFRNKMSDLKKGIHQSTQTEFTNGHKVPNEWIERMRQKKIGTPSKKKNKNYEELYGYERAQEIREKLAILHKNKKLSESHKKALSESHKRQFLDEEFRKRWAIRFHKKPGPLEQKLIEIINSNNLPFKYTGNLSTWVGSAIGVKNPDFTSSVGKKQVIELLGEYWHQKRPNIRFHQTAEGTKEHYKKAGFDCLIIWDYEINKDPQQVLQKIKAFSESN